MLATNCHLNDTISFDMSVRPCKNVTAKQRTK